MGDRKRIYEALVDGATEGHSDKALNAYVLAQCPDASSKKIVRASLLALSDGDLKDRNVLATIMALAVRHRMRDFDAAHEPVTETEPTPAPAASEVPAPAQPSPAVAAAEPTLASPVDPVAEAAPLAAPPAPRPRRRRRPSPIASSTHEASPPSA